jgi:TonB family protein
LLLVIFAGSVLVSGDRRTAIGDTESGIGSFAVLKYWFGGDEERNIEQYAVNQVQPSYPQLAEKYKIQGVVTVQVQVNNQGKVAKAEFVRGHTIFRSVSLDAAKQWEFKPPDGAALVGTIRFNFRLKN